MAKVKQSKPAKAKSAKRKPAASKRVKPAKARGLSGYLVVWRHTMDDVPLGLYANEKDAKKMAEKTTFKQGYAIARRLGIDCGTPVCFAYTVFKDGVATDLVFVTRKDDA